MISSSMKSALGICIAGCLLVTGCDSPGNDGQNVSFQTVEKAGVSPSQLAGGIYVLRSEAEWSGFWSVLKASCFPQPALPSVNFSENAVVAVVDSSHTTGGFSITITRILTSAEGLAVHADHQSPGPDCVVTQALDQPYHIVTTPVFTGEAALFLTETVLDCAKP